MLLLNKMISIFSCVTNCIIQFLKTERKLLKLELQVTVSISFILLHFLNGVVIKPTVDTQSLNMCEGFVIII